MAQLIVLVSSSPIVFLTLDRPVERVTCADSAGSLNTPCGGVNVSE